MWVYYVIAFIVALIAVVALSNQKLENAKPSDLGDFRFPRASEGDPIPLTLGTARNRAPNTIWYGDFKTAPVEKKIKNGFSSKKQVIGYKYFIGMDLALCSGPGVKLMRWWAGKDLVWSGTAVEGDVVTVAQDGLFGGPEKRGGISGDFAFYGGSFSPTVDSYLTGVLGDVPAYNGFSRIVLRQMYIGTSASIDAYSFELQYLPNNLGLSGGKHIVNSYDCNPMEAAFVVLTNQFAINGSPLNIDLTSWRNCGNQLYAEGTGFSLAFEKANSGRTMLDEIVRCADVIIYQDNTDGKFYSTLIRNDYDPNTVQVVDDSTIIRLTDFSQTTWSETVNQVRIQYNSRAKEYNDTVAMDQDFANIQMQGGKVRTITQNYPGIKDDAQAQRLATRRLAALSVPMFRFNLVCNRKAATIKPGHVIKVNWPALGITGLIVRIYKVDLGTLENGAVTLECMQDEFADAASAFAPPGATGWAPVSNPAQVVTQRYAAAAPRALALINRPDIIPGTSTGIAGGKAPSAFSQAYTPIASNDTDANQYEGLEDPIAYFGGAKFHTGYANTEGGATRFDSTTGIHIKSTVNHTPVTRTDTLLREGNGLLYANGEWIAYRTAANLGGGEWQLTNVRRGLLGSTPQTHAVDDNIYFVDPAAVWVSDFPNGETVRVRLLDETSSSKLDVNAAPYDTLALSDTSDRPGVVNGLKFDGAYPPKTGAIVGVAITIDWLGRDDTNIAFFDDAHQAGVNYDWRVQVTGAGLSVNTTVGTNTYNLVTSGAISGQTATVTLKQRRLVGAAYVESAGVTGTITFA